MVENGGALICPSCGYKEGTVPESALHLPPGTMLQGKYLLGKVLGQGGFGITYIAWDKTLDLKLAIKEYFPFGLVSRSTNQPKMEIPTGERKEQYAYGLKRYLEEAKTLARFNEHPNIVTVRDYFEANNTAYLVMNYHEGVTLQNYLAGKGGKIPFDQALAIFMPVLDALKEVHSAGILHRDISPDNLLIDKTGRVILIDFGAARQAMGEKSKTLSVIMKAGYSPPEQYQSRGKQGPWTEIYAVAATMYRALTGQTPLEAIDRMAEDDLIAPSKLGVAIEPKQEEALLKALAVKAKDRYQMVEEFQAELIFVSSKGQAFKGYAGVMQRKTAGLMAADKKHVEEEREQILKADFAEEFKVPEKKPLPAQPPAERSPEQEAAYTISRKTIKTAVLIAACGLIIFGAVSLFNGGEEALVPVGSVTEDMMQDAVDSNDEGAGSEEAVPEVGTENEAQTYAPAVIAALDADYYIDYENGTIPIGDLPIGARIVDPSWEWEFRTGDNYSGSGIVKPVTWIVVAKDHYDGLDPHVTLLAEELIGKHAFDNSTNRASQYGSNHWGESGTANAKLGLRPWLNSSGIHAGEGFYRTFSKSFKQAVLTTTVPNKEWQSGSAYSTQDKVFLPSTTELGDTAHSYTYQIGTAYPHFHGAGDAKRVARIDGETWWYWPRSPGSSYGSYVLTVLSTGEFYNINVFPFRLASAYIDRGAVRPALNLKAEILVSEIRN
jgi:hypothetical protein